MHSRLYIAKSSDNSVALLQQRRIDHAACTQLHDVVRFCHANSTDAERLARIVYTGGLPVKTAPLPKLPQDKTSQEKLKRSYSPFNQKHFPFNKPINISDSAPDLWCCPLVG